MLARLWWKEWRIFSPIWLILGLLAAGLQWVFVLSGGPGVGTGALTPVALVWAVLYAFVAGAAAFAGERETRSLDFLDAVPVGRGTLWVGKVSFALASTLILALLLAGMAALGTEQRNGENYAYTSIARTFVPVMFEGLAWGLFWSALLANPLAAGGFAVASVATASMVANLSSPANSLVTATDFLAPEGGVARSLLAVGALAASAWVMTRRPRAGWSPRVARPAEPVAPIEPRPATTGSVLAWETWREGRSAWWNVVVVGLALPVAALLLGYWGDSLPGVALATLACLVAGVSVFGAEDASGGRRFLLHQGAEPGSVWRHKLRVWGVGMGLFGLVFLAAASRVQGVLWPALMMRGLDVTSSPSVRATPVLANAFAVGVIAGMAFRRRITAALVALIALLAVSLPQMVLVSLGLVPAWSLAVSPLILLGVSRAWAGDWLADRGGPRPWARLAVLLAVSYGLEAAAYVAYRGWGLPAQAPLADPAAVAAPALPPGQDAAEGYREAYALVNPELSSWHMYVGPPDDSLSNRVIEEGWDPKDTFLVRWLEESRPAIERARQAATLPGLGDAGFDPLGLQPAGDPVLHQLWTLASLLAFEARERQARGDLAGAWADILAQLRMARQLMAGPATAIRISNAVRLHHLGAGLAFDWANDPRQTAEAIRQGRADLRAVPPPPTLEATLRVESLLLDRTLALPTDDLFVMLVPENGRRENGSYDLMAFRYLIAPPWERQRARRLCRRLFAEEIAEARQEPWERPRPDPVRSRSIAEVLRETPLARLVFPATESVQSALDREVENRRALDLALALRSWQLGHGGEAPATLEALVPAELDRLPLDPYSGKPFGYTRSRGQALRRPIQTDFGRSPGAPGGPGLRPTRPGQPLLYSVGPDGRDDGAHSAEDPRSSATADDLVVPLP